MRNPSAYRTDRPASVRKLLHRSRLRRSKRGADGAAPRIEVKRSGALAAAAYGPAQGEKTGGQKRQRVRFRNFPKLVFQQEECVGNAGERCIRRYRRKGFRVEVFDPAQQFSEQ